MKTIRKMLLAAALVVAPAVRASVPFADTGAPVRLVDFEVRAMAGGSTIIQNYASCFREIHEIDVSMGFSGGVGARADIAFRDFLALGVEANVLAASFDGNIMVANDEATAMSSCFLRNTMALIDFPIYMSGRFNLGPQVRWIVDLGIYYSYGVWGRQEQNLYSGVINQGGQLITEYTSTRVPLYTSPETFINSYNHSDIGMHFATGFQLRRRLSAGMRMHVGMKNAARCYDAVTVPHVHTFSVMAYVGYRF